LGLIKFIEILGLLKRETIEINLSDILDKINLNYDEFIELCILFGCDYCERVKDLSPVEIYNYYIINKDISKTFEIMRDNNIKVPTINNIDIIKDYFKNAPYIEITDDIKLKNVN
jgi:flap endonuclease-1